MNTERNQAVAGARQVAVERAGLYLVRPTAIDSRAVSGAGNGILASRAEVLAVVGKLNPSGLCFADTADELAYQHSPELFELC